MGINRFDGHCERCAQPVQAGAGVLTGRSGRWSTWCSACRPVPPPRGQHTGWHREVVAALDFETTGVDPHQARIVSYALLDEPGVELVGLADPGVEIPDAARAVHGIDDDAVAAAPAARLVIDRVSAWVQSLIDRRVPLVVYNAAYDLTLLRAECRRHDVAEPRWAELVVIDPFVIEWAVGQGRAGGQRLADVAQFYGVDLPSAHDARCDADVARRVALEQAARFVPVGASAPDQLTALQWDWFAERAADWNSWAQRNGRDLDDPHGWPLAADTDATGDQVVASEVAASSDSVAKPTEIVTMAAM